MSSSSQDKKYSFQRWKKVELFDLASKLKMIDIPTGIKKNELIALIENELYSLDHRLDPLEFPELRAFFSTVSYGNPNSQSDPDLNYNDNVGEITTRSVTNRSTGSHGTVLKLENGDDFDNTQFESAVSIQTNNDETNNIENQTTDSQEEVLSDTVEANESLPKQKKYFNFLNFGDNHGNLGPNESANFKFDFENYLTDIVVKTKQCNQNIQEFLSDLSAIFSVCYVVEFFFLLFSIYKDYNNLNPHDHFELTLEFNDMIFTILTWAIIFIIIPLIFSYYFNFVRYDFDIQFDPMTLNLFKAMVTLILINLPSSLKLQLNSKDEINLPHIAKTLVQHKTSDDKLILYINVIAKALGNIPLVFSIMSCALTIYVYIIYVL